MADLVRRGLYLAGTVTPAGGGDEEWWNVVQVGFFRRKMAL